MSADAVDEPIRAAALAWINRVTLGGTITVTRDQLANDFEVDGRPFPLVDRGRGIRKPVGWSAALSIMTAVPKSGSRARTTTWKEPTDCIGTSCAATSTAAPRTRACERPCARNCR